MDDNREGNKKIFMILLHDFVYPYLDPRVYKEAKSLEKNGYDITIICWSDFDLNMICEDSYEKIKIKRVAKKTVLSKSVLKTIILYFKFIHEAWTFSLREKPDAIHCHDLDTLLFGVLQKICKKTPLVYDTHEDFSCTFEAQYPNKKWLSKLIRVYEKILIHFPDVVIAAESLYTVNFKKYYGIEPEIIKNFPDMDLFNNTVDFTSMLKEHGLNERILFTQVGAISSNRGLWELLDALKYLQNNICLILVGKISKTEQELIENKINREGLNNSILILPNGVKHERTPEYYRASYATIALLHPIPAYVTSVPTKLYESIACGVPVIAANFPHIREIVEKYRVGLCADSQDPLDIADKISILVQNPKLRETMSENCVNLAKSQMNWKLSEEKLIKVYQKLNWTK